MHVKSLKWTFFVQMTEYLSVSSCISGPRSFNPLKGVFVQRKFSHSLCRPNDWLSLWNCRTQESKEKHSQIRMHKVSPGQKSGLVRVGLVVVRLVRIYSWGSWLRGRSPTQTMGPTIPVSTSRCRPKSGIFSQQQELLQWTGTIDKHVPNPLTENF